MIKIIITTTLSLLILEGCAGSLQSSRIAVLQNPETKQTVQCKADPWGDMNYKRQVDNCIDAYLKSGYKMMADSESNH